MRSFIGIDFDGELKRQIADTQQELRGQAVSGRWKYVDNFHLTLKFLGDINSNQEEKVKDILSSICMHQNRFKLKISEIGNFPGRESLRVLWLGLGGDLEKLYQLQAEIEDKLVPIGFDKEKRRYSPHITIGQDIVFPMKFDQVRESVNIGAFPEIRADQVHLFKSEQIGNKRVYTSIYSHNLL